MKNKKIIERNLSLTDRYKLLSIRRQSIETAECVLICANCNAEIVNFATIQAASNGAKYDVGLDCMATLTKAIANFAEYDAELYYFNSTLRDYRLMRSAEKVTLSETDIQIEYKDKKGNIKRKLVFRHYFDNYGFDLKPFERELTEREKRIKEFMTEFKSGKSIEFVNVNESRYLIIPDQSAYYFYKMIDGEKNLLRLINIGEVEQFIEKNLDTVKITS